MGRIDVHDYYHPAYYPARVLHKIQFAEVWYPEITNIIRIANKGRKWSQGLILRVSSRMELIRVGTLIRGRASAAPEAEGMT
jgi:hypothetical protein